MVVVLFVSSCRGRGGVNLLQLVLQVGAPVGNVHQATYLRRSTCLPALECCCVCHVLLRPCWTAGPDCCVGSVCPRRLKEFFPCGPGELPNWSLSKDFVFGLYSHCLLPAFGSWKKPGPNRSPCLGIFMCSPMLSWKCFSEIITLIGPLWPSNFKRATLLTRLVCQTGSKNVFYLWKIHRKFLYLTEKRIFTFTGKSSVYAAGNNIAACIWGTRVERLEVLLASTVSIMSISRK